MREIYTVEDVMNARMVMYPLNLLMCCPTSLGATALVLASESKAKKICKKPVWMKDHVTVHVEYGGAQFGIGEKRWTSHMEAGAKLFKRNHITKPMVGNPGIRDVRSLRLRHPHVAGGLPGL